MRPRGPGLAINQLDQQGFWSRLQVDKNNRIEAVLFAHPDSLAYLQTYPELLYRICILERRDYG